MIGFWNGSVYLTYAGLLSAVCGIFLSADGAYLGAICCLLFSGVCDMFDGKIARAMKRTRDEMDFGIQIDSLCDLVCFGVFPAVLCYHIGIAGFLGVVVLALFVLCGVVRLGFFNVMEQKRQKVETGNRKRYQGLPITTSALVVPAVYLLRPVCSPDAYRWVLTDVMAALGFFYVADISIPKPGKKGGIALIGIGAAILAAFVILAVKGVL